jgi:hypothetical protein
MNVSGGQCGVLPSKRLEHVLGDYVRAGDVGAPGGEVPPGLGEAVDRFCALAEAGNFYEFIPYRGTEQSGGTQEFVARFNVLLERCVAEAKSIGANGPSRRNGEADGSLA